MQLIKLSTIAVLATSIISANGTTNLQKQVADLQTNLAEIQEQLDKVQEHDAKDNIKFTVDFRSEYNYINYDYDKYSLKGTDLSGTSKGNDSLLATRLFLNMKSSPMDKLTFTGQLAAYGVWGGHAYGFEDPTLKGWSSSSRASDTLLRIRQAYFVYSDEFNSDLPYSFSVGRRQSTDGFITEREMQKQVHHLLILQIWKSMQQW